jgi:uncharacterized RDD family membrane protein YckC
MSGAWWRVIPMLILALLLPAWASPVSASDVLGHGTSEMFWVARVIDPPEESDAPVNTVIRGRSVGASWRDVGRLPSRVTSLGHRGGELAVLLESGNWMLLWPGGSSVGSRPGDGARLHALAGGTDGLWALASGGGASPPAGSSTAAATPATDGAAATGRPGNSTGDAAGDGATAAASPGLPDGRTLAATQPASEVVMLYRLERGQWNRVASLDAQVTTGDLPRATFTVVGSRPMVSVLRVGGTVQTYMYAQDRWVTLDPIHAPDAERIKLLSDGERPIVWIAGELGAGRIYLGGQKWSEPRVLRSDQELPAGIPRTVALAGQNLRLLVLRDKVIYEQTFSYDGAALNPATALPMTLTPIDPAPNRVITMAAAAMLMIVVLSSLRRGGGAAPASVAAEAKLTPAPLYLRLLAGLIDASPLLLTVFLVSESVDQDGRTLEDALAQMSLPFYAALGGYLLYTWATETLFSRTIGKMLFGLRVVSLDGTRPSAGAMFARNALRLIDVSMLAIPLVLVLLSPLRQRVGDIAARTLVVRGEPQPAKGDEAESTDPPETPPE